MDKRDKFENKIKEKLEQVPVSDADSAWESFLPMLEKPSPPFYKHWSAPYFFAFGLFLLSLAWQEWERNPEPSSSQSLHVSSIDTLTRRDTIYIIDTVYVYRNQVISELTNPKIPLINENKSALIPLEKSETKIQSHQESIPDTIDYLPPINTGIKPAYRASQDSMVIEMHDLKSTDNDVKPFVDTTNSIDQVTPKSDGVKKRRSMAAPSASPKPERKFVLEKEQAVGDTSKLKTTPKMQKSKPMLHLEAGTSVMLPISKLVDFDLTSNSGIQFGLEWESGWGIYAGVLYNSIQGELDNEEIITLSSTVIDKLPDSPADITALDEINLRNQQLLFPLELRWRSKYYNGFSFESSFGLIGNLLMKQEFGYEFEDDLSPEYLANFEESNFTLSHLKMGIGTNYLLSDRWGLFLRSHYWMPISKTGLVGDKLNGLELGGGINLFIGK